MNADQGTAARAALPGPPGAARMAIAAAALYAALTIALTWPLSRGIAHDVPGDLGDPLFASWVIAWDATHMGAGWWDANIFAPHRLSLAYSEHFLPQALQVLPIYAATRNPILCYNLLFLSTFILSGLGMFLFARELTGSPRAAFVAGLAYAFAPYRIASIPHLQVLSSAWMPFVLFGMRRYFETGRVRPLAGAAAAWLLQNLSCGYYLVFFGPVVAFYIAWELTTRGLWRDRRALPQIGAACLVVAVATLPFVVPYLELRRTGFSARSLEETRRFSADVYAYFTADPNLRVWGPLMQAWPHAEGLLFPGLTIVALAAAGALRREHAEASTSDSRDVVGRILLACAVGFACIAAGLLLGYSIRIPGVKIASLPRIMTLGTAAAAVILATSKPVRIVAVAWMRTPAAWLTLATAFAIAMSFGPDIHARGRTVADTNVYALFYRWVPGFDGLRVPARYAMIAALTLAALAGRGAVFVERRARRSGVLVLSALVLIEACAVPIPINQNATDYKDASLAPLPALVDTRASVPAIYRDVAQLPQSVVLIELPLGEPAFDIRYMFWSTTHWRRLVNGYSGGAPPDYQFLTEALKDADARPDRAWQAIHESTATHVIVHEAFYIGSRGRNLSEWLRSRGATEVSAAGSDVLFALK